MHPSIVRSPLDDQVIAPVPGSAGRILVVDDTFDNRSVLRRRLIKRDFSVVEAENGEQALDLVASQTFDLVLLDVMMPGLSGLEVLVRLRQTFASHQLPVIMVTAKSFSEDVVEALQLGADDYVTKPVDFNVALARINTQIARKRAADELTRRSTEQEQLRIVAEGLVSSEVAAKEKSEANAAYLVAHDPLTGLVNRTTFCGELDSAARRGDPTFSVLFIDLDRFKAVNDAMGHLAGDQLLRLVAARIGEHLSGDDRLGRFGGDEFLILHRHPVGSPSATELGDRIVQALGKSFQLEGNEVTVGASIGVVEHVGKEQPVEAMIADADLAMYAAKKAGGGRVRVFDAQLAEQARRRTELELELQLALKRGELSIVYQPIVNLGTGVIATFEALLRWQHAQRGVISPAEFVPIAEETGLIVQIGDWVLRQACEAAKSWPAGIKVAVNLSPKQFQRGNLVANVMNALAASELPAERLELEITESLILSHADDNLLALRQLRELGVRIVMDDFGTGYSSLSYLRDFEFDKIKVDRSFVRALAFDEGSRAIVSTISNLAMNLGITTTAEGVETLEQLEIIKSSGLHEVQGYFLGRPIQGSDVSQTVIDSAQSVADRRSA